MKTGLYIHIPFCRQACRYCDFYFTVSLNQKEELLKAIGKEIIERLTNSENANISTIYFGGGTPSVLEAKDIQYLLKLIYSKCVINTEPEITLEANPDDLSYEYLQNLLNLGINRLSIGIQSFCSEDLLLMRRSHTPEKGILAIENAIKSGFVNINADLIYGLPGMSENSFRRNLELLTDYNIQHISAYHITYEAGTVFDHWRKKGRLVPVDEDTSVSHFHLLRSFLKEKEYDHYEISNFARPGFFSVHNSNYWRQLPYIGIGPSAHSYTGFSRRWNYSSNKKYLEGILKGIIYYEEEELSENDLFNEFIMTSLRTKWGMDTGILKSRFGEQKYNYVKSKAVKYLEDELMENHTTTYNLTERGMLLSDYIISDFFI